MSWWVIANPAAGRGREVERRTRAALEAGGLEYELSMSASAEHVNELVETGHAAGATRFVSVGGDGTAFLTLNGLMALPWERPPTLAILPAGSGSDFIRTFALPGKLEAAVRHLRSDDVYRCDVGVLEGGFGRRYFLNVADVGVAAAAVRLTRWFPRFVGSARYAAGFWVTLAGFPARTIELEAGGRSYEGPAINVVVANGQYFGGGMNIAPRAAVMDGMFDIQVFKGPRRHAFTVMPRVVRGTHLHHHGVRRFEAASFTLTCPQEWPVEADGELIGLGPVTGRVVPGAIDFKI